MVDILYNDWANEKNRALMSQEFYGPEFKRLKNRDINTLTVALAKHPEMREVFLKNIKQAIEPSIAKGLFILC